VEEIVLHQVEWRGASKDRSKKADGRNLKIDRGPVADAREEKWFRGHWGCGRSRTGGQVLLSEEEGDLVSILNEQSEVGSTHKKKSAETKTEDKKLVLYGDHSKQQLGEISIAHAR